MHIANAAKQGGLAMQCTALNTWGKQKMQARAHETINMYVQGAHQKEENDRRRENE